MRATTASKLLLGVTGILETGTGLGLLVAPAMLVELLLGAAPAGPGMTVTRVAGVAVFALGVACWLTREDAAQGRADGLLAAMLLYNAGVVVVLMLATGPPPAGILFWPVVLGHVALTACCVGCLLTRTLDERRA